MLPIDLIGVGRSENAVGDKSGLNSVRMSHSVMRVASTPIIYGGQAVR